MAFQMQANRRNAVDVCQPGSDERNETVYLRVRIQESAFRIQKPGVAVRISALSSVGNSLRFSFGNSREAVLTFEFVFWT